MEKSSRIAAAALLAASLGHATPALSVETTAVAFVNGLSSDFADGDLGCVLAKLESLRSQGFEGILVDYQIVSVARLMDILSGVQAGTLDPDRVATRLVDTVAGASRVTFVAGDRRAGSVNVACEGGSVFPAGSAG